ncbi:DUF1002 domain-containing protein [Streptococcus parauberis]|uniref:DUF1002 domain-containing protein n=1 Tax=Streptococcus parauberis TaxID=1348 RepID=UPI000789B3C0|nr:DUF1002 domain-containing protein [Streptococcus parauberis]KYP16918.1 hypothetical protein AKL14_01966 [Streptococcus parauberis]KYP18283.1 hypothetical protein AKL13_01728 [Streptococcus parauberis]KYP20492.1 hypothetical protein TN39_00854 [Streptococcus parauberis]KYP24668.1 hypothetical protein ADO04_00948 [Streptococcus parauberis]KYP27047.1 hypothetical protein TM50_00961 [Streptococcus parauberis]
MKKSKKLMLAGLGLALSSAIIATPVYAATSDVQQVINEGYVQPDYVLGYSLDESQKQETLNLLNYDSANDNQVKTLTTAAYAKIMNVADDASIQLYSSVKIKKLGANDVLKVEIVTPDKITKVTQDMYRNAAVTLGIEHADISVAAPIAVTGESALAGIYYSLEENGAQIPQENKELAQDELKALSDIDAANQGKDGYDTDKLNVALTDIKAQVAKGGSDLTKEDVEKIVTDTLTKYKLDNVISQDQITMINNFAFNLSNSGVITNGDFTKTLNSLKDSIVAKSGNAFKGINLDSLKNVDTTKAVETGKNISQQIVDFFRNLIG